jgi:hypothetical protein
MAAIFVHMRTDSARVDVLRVEARKTWWDRSARQTRSRELVHCEVDYTTLRGVSELERVALALDFLAAELRAADRP